ncbi:MAG: branched-chain amino acid ABC transporter substrate-binding protein, partial [Desulfatirhabdiaceae bacterium]
MKGKYSWWFLIAVVLSVGLAVTAWSEDVINVGSLNDMTGATSDVGKDYAMGIAEAINYVNDTGG